MALFYFSMEKFANGNKSDDLTVFSVCQALRQDNVTIAEIDVLC
jgi:hypothetical protein